MGLFSFISDMFSSSKLEIEAQYLADNVEKKESKEETSTPPIYSDSTPVSSPVSASYASDCSSPASSCGGSSCGGSSGGCGGSC